MVPMLVNVTGRDITIGGKILPSIGEIVWVHGKNIELDSTNGYTVTLRDKTDDKMVMKLNDGTRVDLNSGARIEGAVHICLHKFANVLKQKNFYYIVGDKVKADKIHNCV